MIKLKLNKEELQVIAVVLQNGTGTDRAESLMEMKMIYSILDELQVKFQKKLIEMQSRANMFNAKKETSFNLAYYQAWAIMTLLNEVEGADLFEYNVIRMTANELHQKLV